MTAHTPQTSPSAAAARQTLDRHAKQFATLHLRDLLRDDPNRSHNLSLQAGGLYADFSRQRLDAQVLQALAEWAHACGFESARAALFAGEPVNATEGRAALHTALRGVGGDAETASDVALQRARLTTLAAALRAGELRGFRGEPLRSLVCIGIGGSDLGPRLVCDALAQADSFEVRFVANVDPEDLDRALSGLSPAHTAIAVISKTFTTRETLANARAARAWLASAGCPESAWPAQVIGVTAAPDAARAWGIRDDRLLEFRDWVGGRYSLWSSVGLGIAAACGPETFDALLDGAASMDRHFRDTPLTANLPARMGLVSVWNRSFLGLPSQALIPYAERLRLLPAWLQQLAMESNGKSALLSGGRVTLPTSPIVWGTSGTGAQHSFFQQLHQGPDVVPVDFILVRSPRAKALGAGDERHRILLANGVAQAAALALGRAAPDGDVHRDFPGNRPSTTYVLPQLNATSLGALLACFEHATFTAATVLGINPFDQFGVELGKVLAASAEQAFSGQAVADLDPATTALIARLR
jgi:glucose-6-phosphate isomerase